MLFDVKIIGKMSQILSSSSGVGVRNIDWYDKSRSSNSIFEKLMKLKLLIREIDSCKHCPCYRLVDDFLAEYMPRRHVCIEFNRDRETQDAFSQWIKKNFGHGMYKNCPLPDITEDPNS